MGSSSSEQRLRKEFAGVFSPETIRECLEDSERALRKDARVGSYVVALAGRFTRSGFGPWRSREG
jgi:hypothetical protein